METSGWVQFAIYVIALALITKPMGLYLMQVLDANGKTWLDAVGHPATDALHVTERFRRPDFGHLDIQITIDDPKAYTKPWSVDLALHVFPDTELLEYVCNENEKDRQHLIAH